MTVTGLKMSAGVKDSTGTFTYPLCPMHGVIAGLVLFCVCAELVPTSMGGDDGAGVCERMGDDDDNGAEGVCESMGDDDGAEGVSECMGGEERAEGVCESMGGDEEASFSIN